MNTSDDSSEITRLLKAMAAGDPQAEEQLIPYIQAELHRLAANFMRGERPDHTLQTTALVNEAYLRLLGPGDVDWSNRGHFYAVAATIMRHILVDYARKRGNQKSPPAALKVPLDKIQIGSEESWDSIIDVHRALERLEVIDSRAARVVELRFFAGVGNEEAALALGIATKTVQREWNFAQAWLYAEMTGQHEE